VSTAEVHYRETAELQEELVSEFPGVWDYRWDLTRTLEDFGYMLASARPDDAKAQFARAAAIYAPTLPYREKMARENQTEKKDQEGWLASSYARLGSLLKRAGQPADALVAYQKSANIRERLADESPKNVFHRDMLFQDLLISAELFQATAQPDEAAEANRRARKLVEQLLAEPISLLRRDATTANNCAWYFATTADPAARDPALAVTLAKGSTELDPKQYYSWNTLGVARYRADDWRGAIDALNKSMELSKGGYPLDWFFLAMAHWKLDQKVEARQWYNRAVERINKEPSTDEMLLRSRAEAAELLGVTQPQPSTESND
jgi:tetratricopeptide (TPR) repeat protein